MSGSALSLLAIIAAALFAATMALAAYCSARVVGEYVGTGFNPLPPPLVDALPGSFATKGAGLAWFACDVVAATGAIWTERDAPEQGSANWVRNTVGSARSCGRECRFVSARRPSPACQRSNPGRAAKPWKSA